MKILKLFIVSFFGKNYSKADMEWAFKQGIHEGKLREFYKTNPKNFKESDLNYYMQTFKK